MLDFRTRGFWVGEDDSSGFGDGRLEGVALALLPDAESLAYTTIALKEYLGLEVSRVLGATPEMPTLRSGASHGCRMNPVGERAKGAADRGPIHCDHPRESKDRGVGAIAGCKRTPSRPSAREQILGLPIQCPGRTDRGLH